jgi:hypothetical protein
MSRLHAIYIFGIQCNNFIKMDIAWWWPYTAQTCSAEEGWLDEIKTEIYVYKNILMQQNT